MDEFNAGSLVPLLYGRPPKRKDGRERWISRREQRHSPRCVIVFSMEHFLSTKLVKSIKCDWCFAFPAFRFFTASIVFEAE